MRYRLVNEGNDIVIGPGGAVIGRSAACKVMIDSDDVSRRHARLVIDGAVPRLEDLGSANGVSVNGRRVVDAVVLENGDRIEVAGHELIFVVDETAIGSSPGAPALDALWDDEEAVSFDDGKDTRLTAAGSWLSAALAILRKGDATAASSMARARLRQLLESTRNGQRLEAAVGLEASTLAAELAVALGEGKWIAYVFDLYGAAEEPLPSDVADTVQACLERLPDDESVAALRNRLEALAE